MKNQFDSLVTNGCSGFTPCDSSRLGLGLVAPLQSPGHCRDPALPSPLSTSTREGLHRGQEMFQGSSGSAVGLLDSSPPENVTGCGCGCSNTGWAVRLSLGRNHLCQSNDLVKPPCHEILPAFPGWSRFPADTPVPAGVSCGVAAVAPSCRTRINQCQLWSILRKGLCAFLGEQIP